MTVIKTEEGETIRIALVGGVLIVHVSSKDTASSFTLDIEEADMLIFALQEYRDDLAKLTGEK